MNRLMFGYVLMIKLFKVLKYSRSYLCSEGKDTDRIKH